MVPKFEEFFYPCLKCLSDGNVHTQETLRNYVIDYFQLSETDINTLIKSGKKTQVSDKTSWTVSYFQQAKLIDSPQRGRYQINDFGRKFLSEHKIGFNKADLLTIPAFSLFAAGNKDRNAKKTLSTKSKNESFTDGTPTDLIDNAYSQINNNLAEC